jgi:predicted GNAT family acetyltransferase
VSWRQAARRDLSNLLEFLLPGEPRFVPFTSRLRSGARGHVVYLEPGLTGSVRHSFLHTSSGLLLPAFSDPGPEAHDLAPVLSQLRPMVHSVMGVGRCVQAVESGLPLPPTTRVDYFLMSLRKEEGRLAIPTTPPGLVVRRAEVGDDELLFPLQKGYELEEVVIRPGHFNDAQCMKALRLSLREQLLFVAERGGVALAKAGTNARGYHVDQIGGVYTVPGERGKGLGRAVVSALLEAVFEDKQEVCLFVKKQNRSAIALYERLGFTHLTDYLISYYGL